MNIPEKYANCKIEFIFPEEDGVALVDGLPRILDHEAWDKRSEQMKNDHKYFSVHRNELLEKYPDQWVSVYKGQIIAVDVDRDELAKKIDALGLHRTLPETKFIETNPVPLNPLNLGKSR